MPTLISAGSTAESADPVMTPTNLAPTLPTRTTGDWMLCATECTKPTAAVAQPTGWQTIYNVAGAHGRLALFARITDGTETAPSVLWSGLTTGLAGSPCLARILNWGTGFGVNASNALIVESLGTVSDIASSTTTIAGGAGVTTVADNALVLALGIANNNAASSCVDVGTGATWTLDLTTTTSSGANALYVMSHVLMTPPGVLGDHSWVVTGGGTMASSGVIVVFAPDPLGEPGILTYTRGRR